MSGSPYVLMYCSSFISSMLWSKKSLLFLITFRHTHCGSLGSATRSAHCRAVEKAAWPSTSDTSYRPAITAPLTGLKCLTSSKPVRVGSKMTLRLKNEWNLLSLPMNRR